MLSYVRMTDFSHAMGRTEPAYALLNWIAAAAGFGIWFPNVICAALFSWGLIALSRLQPNPWFAILVGVPYLVIVVAMGYTRQSAALGLVMLALSYFIRRRTGPLLFSLALAATFHNSALLAVPLVGFGITRRGAGTVLVLVILAGILGFEFSGHVSSRIGIFTERGYSSGGAVIRIFMNVVPALLFLSFRRRFTAEPDELRLWTGFSLAALASAALLFFVESTTLVDRLGLYLAPLQIFVWSRAPVTFARSRRHNGLLLFGIICYSLAVQVIWLNAGKWRDLWIPYNNFIWDHSPPRKSVL
jgi:hypothetical protein